MPQLYRLAPSTERLVQPVPLLDLRAQSRDLIGVTLQRLRFGGQGLQTAEIPTLDPSLHILQQPDALVDEIDGSVVVGATRGWNGDALKLTQHIALIAHELVER